MTAKQSLMVDAEVHQPELTPADTERDMIGMVIRDHRRMREAGCKLAEAALRVVRTYDGLHRLSLAAAEWAEAIAAEGDRGPQPKAEIDAALAVDVAAGLSLRQTAKKHGVGVGQVRGAVARAS